MLEPLTGEDPRTLGPFTVEGRLGASAAGTVYLGHDTDGAAAAITVVRADLAGDPELPDRFAAIGRVQGDHTATLVGSDAAAEHPWLATEYVAGPSLREVVRERGPLPEPEVLGLAAGVADALAAIHAAGLVHGDLDADTVLLPPEGPRVIGFGLAEIADPAPAKDVFALGALITHLATGVESPTPQDVTRPLRTLAERCLAPDPADRPTPAEIAEFCRVEAEAHAAALDDHPLAYAGTEPPANPLDLSTGIPSDAVVGPITPEATEDEPAEHPLAYPATEPPANPLDLSTGIPGDAIVGPIAADATPDEPEPLTYPATTPPENPLDLSAGIPGDAIVGPIAADATPDEPESITYPGTAPPENPLDLTAGIPGDAIVGPIAADATPDEPEPITYAATAAPANPLDLSAGITTDSVVGPVVPVDDANPVLDPVEAVEVAEKVKAAPPNDVITAPPIDPADLAALRAAADAVAQAAPADAIAPADQVVEPLGYGPPSTAPPAARERRPSRRRRLVLAGLAAAVLLATAVTVPLVSDNTTAGTPVAAPDDAVPAAAPQPTEATEATCAGASTLTASGSALQHDAMTTIADAWAAECRDSTLNYTPGGTDFGLQQFAAGETDFAVADHALGASEGEIASVAARCAGVGAAANKNLVLQLPLVLTPVVLAYHLPGIDELRLDAPALTAIFSSRLTKWNDKTIAELNPGVRLPAKAITVITRADRAVTTQTLQEYLTAVGGWRSGAGPEFTGKAGQAQRSDSDVLTAVRSVDGAIGYLPNTLARPTREPVVMLVAAGLASAPDSSAVNAAVDSAVADTDDLARLPAAIYRARVDETGIGTVPYPLVHVGYLVACTQYPEAATVAAVRDFLFTALGMQVESASGYQLPFGELQRGMVDLVRQTY